MINLWKKVVAKLRRKYKETVKKKAKEKKRAKEKEMTKEKARRKAKKNKSNLVKFNFIGEKTCFICKGTV